MLDEITITNIRKNGLGQFNCVTIADFIDILRFIEEEFIEGDGEFIHYCTKSNSDEKFINDNKLEEWSTEFLITEEGRPNYRNILTMRYNGFDVYPKETDCFGWLTGIITTKAGQIVFG